MSPRDSVAAAPAFNPAFKRTLGAGLFVACACLGLFYLLRRPGELSLPNGPAVAKVTQGAQDPEPAVREPLAPPKPTVPRAFDWKGKDGFKVVEGTVGNRTMTEALVRAGLSQAEIAKLVAAFGTRLDKTRPKHTYAFVREGKYLSLFEYATSVSDVWQASRSVSSDGTLGPWSARKLDLPVTVTSRGESIRLSGNLSRSLSDAGFEPELAKRLDEAFDGHLDLSRVKAGSVLTMWFRERRVDGRLAGYDGIEAAEITTSQGPVRIYEFEFGTKDRPERGHFDGNARQPAQGGWRMPIPFARVTSAYNPKRMHPVLKKISPHNGVDFAGAPGTPVYSVAAGTVTFVGDGGPCGKMVQVSHSKGLLSSYCHLSRFANARKGDEVPVHELIGYVGSTGRVTGPHLHFAVKRNGEFIDPMSLKMGGYRVVPASVRGQFASRRAELDLRLERIAKPPALQAQATPPEPEEPVYEDLPE